MASTTTLPAPERGNIKATNGETQSAIGAVVEHVEAIKTRLKDIIADFSKTIDLLIGTWCIENGRALLHNDSDFHPMGRYLGLIEV